jgi:predicted DNA-binding protein YlxM (UPF0122 family)
MTSRNGHTLEQKINLIRESERGLSYRELKENFEVFLGCVSNTLKWKHEYVNDYEYNHNKKLKWKMKNDLNQTISDNVYDWFVAQRSKNIPICGPVLYNFNPSLSIHI